MTSTAGTIGKLLSWVVAIMVPLALVLGAVRIVLHPWYLEFEYRTPGFPDDPKDFYLPPELEPFSFEDRLRYARIALDYLVNDEGISFLAEQRFPEGQQAPPLSCREMVDCNLMYNERELQHMVDVKNVLGLVLRVLYIDLAGLLALAIWAWKGNWLPSYWTGWRRGSWITLILIGVILLLVLVFFGVFFVFFHDVFFDPGTWTFWPSDTLIRLFPERFWRDTFLVVGGIASGLAVAIILLLRRNKFSL
jgi:integral membrane protein (TIGR01906 family)